MLKNTNANKGFTLVELLIVIVVIAILAAISVVAYNGIQDRGKTSSAASAGSTVIKKAESHNAIESSYPSSVADFETPADSSLAGSGITVGAAVTAEPADPATVGYVPCPATGSATGATVTYWNYSGAGSVVSKTIGTC